MGKTAGSQLFACLPPAAPPRPPLTFNENFSFWFERERIWKRFGKLYENWESIANKCLPTSSTLVPLQPHTLGTLHFRLHLCWCKLEKVKWTNFDAYLWQTMWNHAKQINGIVRSSLNISHLIPTSPLQASLFDFSLSPAINQFTNSTSPQCFQHWTDDPLCHRCCIQINPILLSWSGWTGDTTLATLVGAWDGGSSCQIWVTNHHLTPSAHAGLPRSG